MKTVFTILISSFVVFSSCTKTTNRGIEIEYRTDTVLSGFVKDTTFLMDTAYWSGYSHSQRTLVAPGPTTYFNTNEGIKFLNPVIRTGFRLQTKKEVNFNGKTIYFKWKANGINSYAIIAPTIKYDPLSHDNFPSTLQGVYLDYYSTWTTPLYQLKNDLWYYTRVAPTSSTDDYEVITSTGNYNNLGGTVVTSRTVPIYTKSGYISLVMLDNWSAVAYVVLGECKVLSQ